MELQQAQKILTIQQAIQTDPIYFVDEFTNDLPWHMQTGIIRSTFRNKVTSVRSCHGAGKSWIGAKTALAFLTAYTDSYAITTAPTFRQVENILWRQIRATYNKSKMPIGGRMYASPRLDLGDEWFAIGLSTKDPDALQGLHPPSGHILVIVDEAAGIPEPIWVAIEAILASTGGRLLMIGNPTTLAGYFYDSHHRHKGVERFHISCFDTPNFTNNGIRNLADLQRVDLTKLEILAPHLITPDWVLDKVAKWGVDSPMFQARCLGTFPSSEINTIIPLDVVEAAATEERREALSPGPHFLGVDPARYGDDKTVITERFGSIVEQQEISRKEGTDQTAGRVKQYAPPPAGIFTDVDGVGGGVNDILRADRVANVVDLNNNGKPLPDDSGLQFANLISQLWYHVAQRFKEGDIAIPGDGPEAQDLMNELSSRRFKITRRGWEVERKEDFKKRIGHSPDQSDSLVYSFASDLMEATNTSPAVGKTYQKRYNEAYKEFEG